MWFQVFLNFTILIGIILIMEIQGLTIPENQLTLKVSEQSKGNPETGINRQGRTFGFMNNGYGPSGPIPPPYMGQSSPYYYQSYYDSGPVIVLRQIGSFLFDVFTQVLLSPPPPEDQGMDYSNSYDYGGGGSSPEWQSEFNENDAYSSY